MALEGSWVFFKSQGDREDTDAEWVITAECDRHYASVIHSTCNSENRYSGWAYVYNQQDRYSNWCCDKCNKPVPEGVQVAAMILEPMWVK